ncbi:MAG: hypothetical protein R3E60_02540 [Alphaproteobacteria bacterium]
MIGETGLTGQVDGEDVDAFVGVERRLDQAADVRGTSGRVQFFGDDSLLQLRCG